MADETGRPPLEIRVVVIDDERDFVDGLCAALDQAGFRAFGAYSAMGGLSTVERVRPHLILLDIRMPGDMDGRDVMMRLWELGRFQIIILSALGDQQAIVPCLQMGADDYVVKPFSMDVLLARMRAVLRRAQARADAFALYRDGHLVIDEQRNVYLAGGRPLALGPIERMLLCELVRNRDKVVMWEDFIHLVWPNQGEAARPYLAVYIKSLREKIEPEPGQPFYIQNKRGVGYLFQTRADG